MHTSHFNYNVSRPLPFPWFTPVVIVGGIIATILVSTVNFAATGYTLVSHITPDPNTTCSQTWLNRWPSFVTSKVLPTVEPTSIDISTKLSTNNSALTYELNSVFRGTIDSQPRFYPSLTYRSNPLYNCAIHAMEIQLESLDRTAAQYGLSGWGADVRALVTCDVFVQDTGLTTLNLTVEYNYIPKTVSVMSGMTAFTGRNKTANASLYWGESLLSVYWAQLVNQVWFQNKGAERPILKGVVVLRPNNGSISDFANLDYFDLDWRFILQHGPNNANFVYYNANRTSISSVASTAKWPNIWISANNLAKSLHSTVLTDLGQTTAQPNIINEPRLLEHFTANFSQIINSETGHFVNEVGPARQNYNDLKDEIGPLGVNPSVISTAYLCQVPHRKTIVNLVISILIASFVFLNVLWLLFKFVVIMYLERRYPHANDCVGCVEQRHLNNSYKAAIQRNSSDGGSSNIASTDSHQMIEDV